MHRKGIKNLTMTVLYVRFVLLSFSVLSLVFMLSETHYESAGTHDSSVAQPPEDVRKVRAETSNDRGVSSDDLSFLAFSYLNFQISKF